MTGSLVRLWESVSVCPALVSFLPCSFAGDLWCERQSYYPQPGDKEDWLAHKEWTRKRASIGFGLTQGQTFWWGFPPIISGKLGLWLRWYVFRRWNKVWNFTTSGCCIISNTSEKKRWQLRKPRVLLTSSHISRSKNDAKKCKMLKASLKYSY